MHSFLTEEFTGRRAKEQLFILSGRLSDERDERTVPVGTSWSLPRDRCKSVSLYIKGYRDILDSDIYTLRRPDGRDWDGIMHANPALKQKAFIPVYNPLDVPVEKDMEIPLYYTGLARKTVI